LPPLHARLVPFARRLREKRRPQRSRAPPVGRRLAAHRCFAPRVPHVHAIQNAPPAGAALLQAFTPLLIVVGSALLPGERLRWRQVAGTLAGLIGTMFLVTEGEGNPAPDWSAVVPLTAAGLAAASWAIYSVLNRRYSGGAERGHGRLLCRQRRARRFGARPIRDLGHAFTGRVDGHSRARPVPHVDPEYLYAGWRSGTLLPMGSARTRWTSRSGPRTTRSVTAF
jgi:EamA-like transporter family